MNDITFSSSAWNDYLYWQMQDKKTLRRINQLLKDIQRSSFDASESPSRSNTAQAVGAEE